MEVASIFGCGVRALNCHVPISAVEIHQKIDVLPFSVALTVPCAGPVPLSDMERETRAAVTIQRAVRLWAYVLVEGDGPGEKQP